MPLVLPPEASVLVVAVVGPHKAAVAAQAEPTVCPASTMALPLEVVSVSKAVAMVVGVVAA